MSDHDLKTYRDPILLRPTQPAPQVRPGDLTRAQLEELLGERDHRVIDPGIFQLVVGMALKWSDYTVRQQILWDLEKQAQPETKGLRENHPYDSGEV